MQTLFIVYDETFEFELQTLIEQGMIVSRFTRVDSVIGARAAATEDDAGDIPMRRNRLILIIAEEPTIARLVQALKELRARKKRGLRAFVVNAETVI